MKLFGWTVGGMAVALMSVGMPAVAADLDMAQTGFGILTSVETPTWMKLDPANRATQVGHAQELMGRYYGKSVVKVTENVEDVREFVLEQTRKSLPPAWKSRARKVAQAILRESNLRGFDPLFVMAVIRTESSFRPDIRGTSGEIGLMQILPATAAWIAKKYDIPFKGPKDLGNPVRNIRIGTAFLSMLREQFDSHGRLYLSAYNMGPRNVRDALGRSIWPKEYASRIMDRYLTLYKELSVHIQAANAKPVKLATQS